MTNIIWHHVTILHRKAPSQESLKPHRVEFLPLSPFCQLIGTCDGVVGRARGFTSESMWIWRGNRSYDEGVVEDVIFRANKPLQQMVFSIFSIFLSLEQQAGGRLEWSPWTVLGQPQFTCSLLTWGEINSTGSLADICMYKLQVNQGIPGTISNSFLSWVSHDLIKTGWQSSCFSTELPMYKIQVVVHNFVAW